MNIISIAKNLKTIAVIPAYNEEGKIGKVVKAIPRDTVSCILVISDGSEDGTYKEAQECGAMVIQHPKNMGVGAAIRTGIDYAIKNYFDIVVIMGGDDQDNPNEIPLLLKPLIDEGYDFVQGSRYMEGGKVENMPLFRNITTLLYSFFFRLLTGSLITDGTNGFRAFKTEIFNDKRINIHQEWLNTYELEPYLYFKAIKCGFKVKEVPVTKRYPADGIGYTKMIPFRDWWRILKPLIFLKLGLRK